MAAVHNVGRATLQELNDRIVSADLNHTLLADKLYRCSEPVLTEEDYKTAIDRCTGQTNRERIGYILTKLESAVSEKESCFHTFKNAVKLLGHKKLVEELETVYNRKGTNSSIDDLIKVHDVVQRVLENNREALTSSLNGATYIAKEMFDAKLLFAPDKNLDTILKEFVTGLKFLKDRHACLSYCETFLNILSHQNYSLSTEIAEQLSKELNTTIQVMKNTAKSVQTVSVKSEGLPKQPTKPVSDYVKRCAASNGVDIKQLLDEVPDRTLLMLAKNLNEYYFLLDHSALEAIKRECVRDEQRCRIKVVRRWKETNGNDATYLELVFLLESAKRKDLVDCVIKSIVTPNPAEGIVERKAEVSCEDLRMKRVTNFPPFLERCDYYILGSWLGFNNHQLMTIQRDGENEAARGRLMISQWQQEKGQNATYWELAVAVASCDRRDLLDELMKDI